MGFGHFKEDYLFIVEGQRKSYIFVRKLTNQDVGQLKCLEMFRLHKE